MSYTGIPLDVTESITTITINRPGLLAAVKDAFPARHTGVVGQSRLAQDQILTYYLTTGGAGELSAAFNGRRDPDPGEFMR